MNLLIEALQDIISPNEKKVITTELIVDIVAEHFNISPADIYSKDKSRSNFISPSDCNVSLPDVLTELSVTDIGKSLGNRDHSTVIHGYDKIQMILKRSHLLHNTIDVLIKKINPE